MKHPAIIAALLMLLASSAVQAQENATDTQDNKPKTLFPYPVAPDTIKNFQDRVNYIVPHFWEKYDLSKPITDLPGFNGAFRDYIGFFRFCHRNVAVASVRDFINKVQSNIANLEKVAQLAELNLFSIHAEYWSDEIYVQIMTAITANKALKAEMRNYYAKQLERVNFTQPGADLSQFTFTDTNGDKKKIGDIEADNLLVLITRPDNSDDSFQRVRLSTDVTLNQVIATGKVKVLSITAGKYSKEWAHSARDFADNWTIGASADFAADGPFDIRFMPNIILLDKDKKLLQKNIAIDAVKNIL